MGPPPWATCPSRAAAQGAPARFSGPAPTPRRGSYLLQPKLIPLLGHLASFFSEHSKKVLLAKQAQRAAAAGQAYGLLRAPFQVRPTDKVNVCVRACVCACARVFMVVCGEQVCLGGYVCGVYVCGVHTSVYVGMGVVCVLCMVCVSV